MIRAKDKAIHCACITNWDAFEVEEREAQIFFVDEFDMALYSELCKLVYFLRTGDDEEDA